MSNFAKHSKCDTKHTMNNTTETHRLIKLITSCFADHFLLVIAHFIIIVFTMGNDDTKKTEHKAPLLTSTVDEFQEPTKCCVWTIRLGPSIKADFQFTKKRSFGYPLVPSMGCEAMFGVLTGS
jgi:hypothetical protein